MIEFIKGLIAFLTSFLKKVEAHGMKPELSPKPLHRNIRILKAGAGQLGTKEYPGAKSNPVVEMYLDYGFKSNKDSGLKDDVPWCAGFICYLCEISGMGSTNSLMARSFERWGVSKKHSPMPGDIITFWRGSKAAGTGHVGLFLGYKDANHVYVLGGNQNDEVNVSVYGIARMTDIRRSSKAARLTNAEVKQLNAIRDDILKTYGYKVSGSVV